ncbi:hypothetical protein R1flu_011444 [Riccia fluitans]|uniref:Poly(A) RNA polymerase mitochondrial-like central palm domain-containing protein n=1 Tax=Riccia fluitans TaxID=41844 RepID=A0ABD1Z7U7_9MARC
MEEGSRDDSTEEYYDRERTQFYSSDVIIEKALEDELKQEQLFFSNTSLNLMKDMFDEVFDALRPRSADGDERHLVIQFIEKFVKNKIPGCSISAFGSFVMELYTSSSDLDLSLNLSDGTHKRSRSDKVHYLRKVASALYALRNGSRTVRSIETIYRAAVPVVKFIECKTGIECDISVENNDGVLKSRMLGMIASVDARFKQLCYMVKAWAKKHNVNSSKNGTLNSLSICLLVAFHLQTCSPPILPPFSEFMEGIHLPAIEESLDFVAARVRSFRESGFGSNNRQSIPDLFGSFFVKLVAVQDLWRCGLCSSTYEGRWISKMWPKNHIGLISVEDFVDRTQNVARSVSRKEFDLIYEVLYATYHNLKDPLKTVADCEDLKAYLFGSIRNRRRSSENSRIPATNRGPWQNSNGWPLNDSMSQVSSNRGDKTCWVQWSSEGSSSSGAKLVSTKSFVCRTTPNLHLEHAQPFHFIPYHVAPSDVDLIRPTLLSPTDPQRSHGFPDPGSWNSKSRHVHYRNGPNGNQATRSADGDEGVLTSLKTSDVGQDVWARRGTSQPSNNMQGPASTRPKHRPHGRSHKARTTSSGVAGNDRRKNLTTLQPNAAGGGRWMTEGSHHFSTGIQESSTLSSA